MFIIRYYLNYIFDNLVSLDDTKIDNSLGDSTIDLFDFLTLIVKNQLYKSTFILKNIKIGLGGDIWNILYMIVYMLLLLIMIV